MVHSYYTPNDELIAELSLLPHPEGGLFVCLCQGPEPHSPDSTDKIAKGYFAETMRASETVPSPFAQGELRPIQTSIYYLLTAESNDNYFHMNKSTVRGPSLKVSSE